MENFKVIIFILAVFIPKFTWPLAFLLGAIISPPDAAAASGFRKKTNKEDFTYI
jgi:NhaP-type Na+/H+ or K+/H+ antiporter